jgi:uncharacterized repeat protein (TIGR03803 family)
MAGLILMLWAATGIASEAQTFTTLVTFDVTNGAYPSSALVQGLDGNFYGTTQAGNGRNQCFDGCGEVFKVTPAGALTIVHSFDKTDGGYPVAGLVLATSGNFYGSTDASSVGASSIVPSFFFEITPEGTLTNFLTPYTTSTAMIQYNVNGNLYGTAVNGTVGQIFAMTPSGTISTVYNFDNPSNLEGAPLAPLVEGTDGFFYGTTENGGDKAPALCQLLYGPGCGMVFKTGIGGHLGIRHIFNGTDGAKPLGGLIQGSDGNFYGTTEYGGASGGGTIFEMTPAGVLTPLHSFGCSTLNCPGGAHPVAGVVQATDGNFYGTTYDNGINGYGTIFQLTPSGTLTTLLSFDKTVGVYPTGGLVQGTDGNFYGTTGGTDGLHLYGTVFKLSLGLPPFVKMVPTAAYPGTTIFILGTDLTGATAVSFNGKAALFTVVSPTEITAMVPKGSTTGAIEVNTPGGTLSSNIPFRVF